LSSILSQQYTMQVSRTVAVKFHALTSDLDLSPPSDCFTPVKTAHGTQCTPGLEDTRFHMNVVMKKKVPAIARNLNPVFQPAVSQLTD
jgi:hypothetical protein